MVWSLDLLIFLCLALSLSEAPGSPAKGGQGGRVAGSAAGASLLQFLGETNSFFVISGRSKEAWLVYFPILIGNFILPIDELIFFQRGEKNHQPDKVISGRSKETWYEWYEYHENLPDSPGWSHPGKIIFTWIQKWGLFLHIIPIFFNVGPPR